MSAKLLASVREGVIEALGKVVMRGQRFPFDIVVVPDDDR